MKNTIMKTKTFTKEELLILSELIRNQVKSNRDYYKSVSNPDIRQKKFYFMKLGQLNVLQNKVTSLFD
jgi:hypothetical protein